MIVIRSTIDKVINMNNQNLKETLFPPSGRGSEEIRILLVDQFPIIEEGLESFLQDYPDLRIVATAQDGLTGLEELRRTAVDVAILDLALPELDGAEAILLYLEQHPGLGVIVYSGQADETSVYRALKAGARGYVLKSSPISELAEAIRAVQRGDFFLSPSLNPAIIQFYLDHRGTEEDELGSYERLSDREQQVFRLLADGKQTNEIAEILCISPKTVAKHRVAIKKKLDLQSPAEMTQYAIRLGLISFE